MTKEQYFQLKDELKALAKKISSDRYEFKNKQRILSQVGKTHDTVDDADNSRDETKQKNYHEAYSSMWKAQEALLSMKHECRAKHIAYSMARGKTIDQIEPVVSSKGGYDYWRDVAYRRAKDLCEKLNIEPLFERTEVAA